MHTAKDTTMNVAKRQCKSTSPSSRPRKVQQQYWREWRFGKMDRRSAFCSQRTTAAIIFLGTVCVARAVLKTTLAQSWRVFESEPSRAAVGRRYVSNLTDFVATTSLTWIRVISRLGTEACPNFHLRSSVIPASLSVPGMYCEPLVLQESVTVSTVGGDPNLCISTKAEQLQRTGCLTLASSQE